MKITIIFGLAIVLLLTVGIVNAQKVPTCEQIACSSIPDPYQPTPTLMVIDPYPAPIGTLPDPYPAPPGDSLQGYIIRWILSLFR